MKKQKRGSRLEMEMEKGGEGWIIRLRETEVRPGRVRGQSLVRVQVAKRKKISENGDEGEARVPPPLSLSLWVTEGEPLKKFNGNSARCNRIRQLAKHF